MNNGNETTGEACTRLAHENARLRRVNHNQREKLKNLRQHVKGLENSRRQMEAQLSNLKSRILSVGFQAVANEVVNAFNNSAITDIWSQSHAKN